MIYIAYFFAGAFLVNGVPHFVHGISGSPFQSPFASPPGVGESPPVINVLWGTCNFLIGFAIVAYTGFFVLGFNLASFAIVSGAVLFSVVLAIHFGRVRNRE